MRVFPARTLIGAPPVTRPPAPVTRPPAPVTRPPAPVTRPPAPDLPVGDDRARMIQHTRLYAATARRWGFQHVAGICELAASALEALDDAEQRLALLLQAERFDEQTAPINPEALRRARAHAAP